MSLLDDIDTISRGCGIDLIGHAMTALNRSHASADTAHESQQAQRQKDVSHAGLGSVEAGTLYPVTCRARYYDAASKVLEDEPNLFTHDNADELGHVIQKWIEEANNNSGPRT